MIHVFTEWRDWDSGGMDHAEFVNIDRANAYIEQNPTELERVVVDGNQISNTGT